MGTISGKSKILALIAALWMLSSRPALPQAFMRGSPVPRTYSASFSIACGGAGDCVTLSLGATGVTEVREIWVVTPTANITVSLIRRSTADSGGTSTAITAVAHDLSAKSPNTTVTAYTVAPTAGTSAGTMFAAAVTTTQTLVRAYTAANEQPILLQASSEYLALNVSGAATMTVDLIWGEE